MELLATAVFAILLTLLCALFVFYGVYRKQVIGDLKADALVMKNMHIFDDISDLHPDAYDLNPDTLRITVINASGNVIFDSNADFTAMENHEDRPEIHMALENGEGSDTRRSTTLDKNMFYYAIRLDNGRILRIAREGDNIFALTQNMMLTVVGVFVLLFFFCILMSNYFTKNLVAPIEKMAENLSEPGTQAAYKELVPFMNKIRQQHEDILKSSQVRQEFTANVSHELKTPITSIRVLADSLMGMEDAPKELYQEFMHDISDEIDRESKIIDDLLTLVRMDKASSELSCTQVQINGLIEMVLKRLRPIARKRNIELIFESKRDVTADIDEVKFSLAINNLVENAVKYNKEDGWVRVTLDADHKFFYLKVADSGIGIPAEFKERVFERFYRVDKARSRETGGTGLGLAITRSVVLMHHGAIRVDSVEGEGSTFMVRIPLIYIP